MNALSILLATVIIATLPVCAGEARAAVATTSMPVSVTVVVPYVEHAQQALPHAAFSLANAPLSSVRLPAAQGHFGPTPTDADNR